MFCSKTGMPASDQWTIRKDSEQITPNNLNGRHLGTKLSKGMAFITNGSRVRKRTSPSTRSIATSARKSATAQPSSGSAKTAPKAASLTAISPATENGNTLSTTGGRPNSGAPHSALRPAWRRGPAKSALLSPAPTPMSSVLPEVRTFASGNFNSSGDKKDVPQGTPQII